MNTDVVSTPAKTYCNCLALDKGLDPVGHAGEFEDAIVVEVPLPWKRDMLQAAGTLPQQMIDLLNLWLQQYYAGEGYPHRPLAVAPDPAYSREGFRRVMLYTRPTGAFARFDKVEYHVPVDELGALVWSLYQDRAALPHFERYRVPEADAVRDLLVCTHGTIDAACAKFGYPLYKYMRDTYSDQHVRVWRVSHFGGHVFAPTLMDMPNGHYWAYVGAEQADQIVQQTGDVAMLRGHYRGWAGVCEGFQQAAECELWQKYGWKWFSYPKQGITLLQDKTTDEPKWAEVQLTYSIPDDSTALTENIRVEVSHTIETLVTTGEEGTYAYPQYRAAAWQAEM